MKKKSIKPRKRKKVKNFEKFEKINYDRARLKALELSPDFVEEALRSIVYPGKPRKETKTVKKDVPNRPALYVFRHGESYDNKKKLFSGWHDSDLTPRGIKQAQRLAEKLKDKSIDVAYTSNLKRAKKTLDIVLKYHPKTKVIVDDRITERSYGDLVGLSKYELYLYNPKLCAALRRSYDFPIPGGETMRQVEKRVKDFLDELIQKMKKEKINVAISCHGNSMRVIRRLLENLSVKEMLLMENPLAEDYCSYAI